MHMRKGVRMAKKQRRERGTGAARVGFYAEVDPDVKDAIDAAAKNLGVAKWSLVAELVRHAERSADWWPRDVKTEDFQQEVMEFPQAV